MEESLPKGMQRRKTTPVRTYGASPTPNEVGWMTEGFIPFEGMLEFESPVFSGADKNHFNRCGSLILRKDNPSGLPEHDDALEIPILFGR